MGCGSCGTSCGTPNGCQSHGSCGTGSCNKMNTHDWLSSLPVGDQSQRFPFVELSFKKGQRKEFFKNTLNDVITGDYVCVESSVGFDIGMISLSGELVRYQMKKKNLHERSVEKRVLRLANEEELKRMNELRDKEIEAMKRSRVIAKNLKMDMKISDVEFQGDGKKAIFYYIAEGRVDFRELIKLYAREFNVKVEMKQIGSRQEAGLVGGIGMCGRELCCSTWLTSFKNVNISVVRYQNLSINQAKLSGQCGRLKCCLNYELDTYLDALKEFPKNADRLHTEKGEAYLQKTDIFKSLMWYSYKESTKLYPMAIERVNEILELNKQKKLAPDLEQLKEKLALPADTEPKYEDLVGQASMSSLKKTAERKKQKNRNQQGGNKPKQANRNQADQGNRQGQAPQQNRGQQKPQQQGNKPNPNANRGPNPANKPNLQQPNQQGGPKPAQQPQQGQGGPKPTPNPQQGQGNRPPKNNNRNNNRPRPQVNNNPKPSQPDSEK